MAEKIKVVIVEPYREPKVKEISNTLKELQKIVGGYIEIVPLQIGNNLSVICNEEGKLLGLLPNRSLGQDVLCGTFLVVSTKEDEFVSLTGDEIGYITKRFALN